MFGAKNAPQDCCLAVQCVGRGNAKICNVQHKQDQMVSHRPEYFS